MKKEAEELIKSYVATLKKEIVNQEIYEHIITSILEIYTEQLPYSKVLNQIVQDVEGIRGNKEVFNSLCFMAESLASYNSKIKEIYTEELSQNRDEWEYKIAGDIHDFIYNDA